MPKINLHISEQLLMEIKIMAVMTRRSMSQFIRQALQEKMKDLKEKSVKNFISDRDGIS